MSTQTLTQTYSEKFGSIVVRGSTEPLPRNHSLDKWTNFEVTPVIGQEFDKAFQLSEVMRESEERRDQLIRDLARLVSERGVVFFRGQNLNVEDQKVLGEKLGELSGKPSSSTLHIHPTTEADSVKGDNVTLISSQRRSELVQRDRSRLASTLWHSDITFEPVPSDYAILKIHTNPSSGGDTLWASGYEAYSRLSPSFAKYLEGLSALHEAAWFKKAAKAYHGGEVRTGQRGSPLNEGDALEAVHPVIRVNPVTGWKSLFVNKEFTKRILGVSRDESDWILDYLFKVVSENHDLQVRFKWAINNPPGLGDIAIWDNRSTYHSATNDYEKQLRTGDRVVSIGEKPYFDPNGKDRREALGLPGWFD